MGNVLEELKSLLPPGVFFEQEEEFDQILVVLANEFTRIQCDAKDLLREFNPKFINRILLEDWSRIYNLGDLSVQAKKDEILSRMYYQGGQQKSIYMDLVRSYGCQNFEVEECLSSFIDGLS